MHKQDFYRKLTEAVSDGILKAIDGDEMFDTDETELKPIEDDDEDSSTYVRHSKLYTDLLNKGIECHSRGIELTLFDNYGNEVKTTENAADIRFVKFSTEKLKHCKRGIDNSIVISTHWKEHYNKINYEEWGGHRWQDSHTQLTRGKSRYDYAEKDLDGCLNTRTLINKVKEQGKDYKIYIPAIAYAYDTKENLNGRTIRGYLPAMGQLRFMCDNIDLINDVLKMLYVEQIDIQSFEWWSSTEWDDYNAWGLYRGITTCDDKNANPYILPLFDLSNTVPMKKS